MPHKKTSRLLRSMLLLIYLSFTIGKLHRVYYQSNGLSRASGYLFYRRINCIGNKKLTIYDKLTGKPLPWIKVADDEKSVFSPIRICSPGVTACIARGHSVCECFKITTSEKWRFRRRRSVVFGCPASVRLTKAAINIDARYASLSTAQQNAIKTKTATFFGISADKIVLLARNKNIFYPYLQAPNFLANGKGTGTTSTEVTSVEYLIACQDISPNDAKVDILRNAVNDGRLAAAIGYSIGDWRIVSGVAIQPTAAPTSAPSVGNPPKITLPNTTFRTEYLIPANTFNDGGGGNTRQLTLYLYQSDGRELPKNSWVSLNQQKQTIKLFTSKAIFDQQPSGGYSFRLSAIASSGKTAMTNLQVNLAGPITPPNYMRTLILSSTTSVVVTSYKDVDVLFLLQDKMALYLNISASNFVNSIFSLTRTGNTALSIRYTFSTQSLVGPSCDVNSINQLRQKMTGASAEAAFKQALQPQFTVTSMSGEAYAQACSQLSSSAATVSTTSSTQNVRIGQYFSYSISRSLFQSPPGSNMRLRLELRFRNNTILPSSYWVGLSARYLDQNPKVQGLASWSTAVKQSLYSFKLVAMTPVLAESFQAIQFNLPTATPLKNILFRVSLTQSSAATTSYAAFANSFVTYMSSYLGLSKSDVILLNYQTTTTITTVSWTIKTLSQTPCNTAKINEVKSKLTNNAGGVNSNLQTGLSNAAKFSPTSIKMKLTGSCDMPVVNYKIPMLYIPQYGALQYVVPSNAFKDGSDGFNLTLSLLQQNGQALEAASWIWFNQSSRVISGYPLTVTKTQMFNYILRAVDSDGMSVNQSIQVSLPWVAPKYNLLYSITFSYSSAILPISNVITTFMTQLKSYFKQSTTNNIIIQQKAFMRNSKMRIFYQNTSLRTDKCDVTPHYAIWLMLLKKSTMSTPNPNLVSAMQPLFRIEEIGKKLYGKCIQANRKAPEFNAADDEALTFLSTQKYISYCNVGKFVAPEKLFFDEEEGYTRKLKLSLLDSNSKALPLNNWVNLNSTSQTILAVPDDTTRNSIYMYELHATDSDRRSGEVVLEFAPSGTLPVAFYNVTMIFAKSGLGSSPYVLQIDAIVTSLMKLFPNGPSINVRSYNVQQNGVATLVWTPCGMITGVCNSTIVRIVRAAIFVPGTKAMSPTLTTAIDKRFRLTGVRESLNGPCAEDRPVVVTPIPTLSVGFCGPFSYEIPANTFMDKQDGNTKKLALKLIHRNGSPIQSNYWLRFDSSKQSITAVLTKSESVASYPKSHSFILSATDATSLTTNTTVNVVLTGAMSPYSHTFTLQTQVSLPQNSHMLFSFAKRLADYFSDARKNVQVISQSAAANNMWIISWSNCSIRYSPCDALGLKSIKDKMQTNTGVLKPAFQQRLAPEFTKLFLSETNLGPCLTNQPPRVGTPFGSISVTTCQTFKTRIPEATFNDNEQGNTRNLNLSLKNNKHKWISFDSTKQELTILATNEIAASLASKSATIVMVAADLGKQEARQDIVVTVTAPSKPATQKITMQYRISSSSTPTNFISLYNAVRQNIIQYFSSTTILTSVEYAKVPVDLQRSKIQTMEWSSCSLPRDQCDNNLLNTMSGMVATSSTNPSVNARFKTALQQNIEVVSATFTRNGLCKDQITPPVVQNPLPILNISYCGYLTYEIPVNTFYDNIDGNTRNLALSVVNSSNQAVNEKWIYLDAKTQKLTVVLSDDSIPSPSTSTIMNYRLKASTKRGIAVYDKLRFQLTKEHPNVSYSIKMNFAWRGNNPRNTILTTVLDRFAQYFSTSADSFHYKSISQEALTTYPYFVVEIANCSARYSPCDHAAVAVAQAAIYNVEGTLQTFRTAMGTMVQLTYTQLTKFGPCAQTDTPPIVEKPLRKIKVYTCTFFTYDIPKATITDEEDESLTYTVTQVNGMPVSGNYDWVYFVSKNRTLYGVVTDSVLKNQPAGGYNLTIRGTDSGGLYAETSLMVEIIGNNPQAFYQFSLQLTGGILRASFLNKLKILEIVNGYFKSNFTNIVSYTRSSTSSNQITVKCSICTLPKKCDESAASAYFNQIITPQNTVPAQFAARFTSWYTQVKTSVYRDPLCQQPLNPPVPRMSVWTIKTSYCGGLSQKVPADLFTDKEDGNTRSLSLDIYLNSAGSASRVAVSKTNWLQINKTSQTVYGWPTRETTLKYKTTDNIFLVASDKTGQEGSIKIQFSFTQHAEPKYTYRVIYSSNVAYTILTQETISFATRLQAYIKDTPKSSLGLTKHQSVSGRMLFEFANCSVSYNPCDRVALTRVKNLLFKTTNLVTPPFQQAMKPTFHVFYGQAQALSPCSGSANHPPTVRSRITTIYILVCGAFTSRVPSNTFYDTEDGDTRKLSLSLLSSSNSPIPANSWMQLNKASQTLTAFATATLASSQPATGYPFILTATDSSRLSASNSFRAKLYGPVKPLTDCQIQMTFSADASLSSNSNNQLIQLVVNGLSSFFKLPQSEIGLVNFIRQSSTQFSFSWGYCSPSYARYISLTSISQTIPVDHKGIVTKILIKLFKSDRKTVQTAFYSAFSRLTVRSIKTLFTGSCSNFPPVITPNITRLTYTVTNCGYRKEAIQSDLFYDFEDGGTFSLKLSLLKSDSKPVDDGSWIDIDERSKSLIMSLRDAQRENPTSSFVFYLQATDAGGKSATLQVHVNKLRSTTTMSPFNITFEFTIANTVSAIYVNESIILSDTTAQLYSLVNGQAIVTRKYSGQYGPQVSRSFTWLTCAYQDCSTSGVLQKTKQLLQRNLNVFNTFKQSFQSNDFMLQRAYYASSCNTPDLPPSPSSTTIQFNITMCTPLRYKVPVSTFVDRIDGELNNMRLRLLSNSRSPLPSNSWIQLNTATMEIYAIYQSSLLKTTTTTSMTSSMTSSASQPHSEPTSFQLEATNSQGLKSYKQIQVNVVDYPYTSDCLVDLKVTRNFGPNDMTDLDVLYSLVNAISNYYQDKSISIKVTKFMKTSSFQYSLTFSNCSFVFSTSAAATWGLNESYRQTITAIFSRMVKSDGTAKTSFTKYLSSKGFTLSSIKTSYSCIEAPPQPSVEKIRAYAWLCTEFKDLLSTNLFNDTRDGTNLQLTLCYTNGNPVPPNEWVQIDSKKKLVYGRVTRSVKLSQPSFIGYSYLIKATDSSGRTANVTYQIKISNQPPITDVKFVLGFRSTFSEESKTADLLLNVTRKIGLYLDGNAQSKNIEIYSYNAMYLVTWENCTMKCRPNDVTAIASKLQKVLYKPTPSDAFIAAMKPEITPTYINVNGPKCLPARNEVIIVSYRIIITMKPLCGYFSYDIPANQFKTASGLTTKDLFLNMTSSGSTKSKSTVHFRKDSASLEVVPVFSRISSSSMSYKITATSPRSSSPGASSTLRIDYRDYTSLKSVQSKLCTIKTTVTTRYNPDFNDVYILKKFIQKIARFLNSPLETVQVISYSRSAGYPVRMTISFAKCNWFSLLQSQTTSDTYYQSVSTVLKKVFTYSGSTITGYTKAFTQSLTPDFNVVSVVTNITTCSQPPDKPPVPKSPLTTITAAGCGEFNYRIPTDFFSDESGDTRALSLELLNGNKFALSADSWVVFNNKTQTISGLPLNKTLVEQPLDGYQYVVKATDKNGKSGFGKLRIKIDGKPFRKYDDMTLTLLYRTTIRSKFEMDYILAITRKVSSFRTINDPKNQLRVIKFDSFPNQLLITLVNCSRCNPVAQIKFSQLQLDYVSEFKQHMKPEFPWQITLKADGKCNPGDAGYANKTKGVIYNATFCAMTKLDYSEILGITKSLPGTKLSIRGVDFQALPVNSWFWFNETSYVIEAFANEAVWKLQPANGTAYTWANVDSATGQVLSAVMEDRLRIVGSPPSSGLQYSLTIDTTYPSTTIDAYFISLAFKSLESYLGRSDLQFVSLSRQQGTKLRLLLKFVICGLPSDCTNASVKTLDNKIFESPGKLRPAFKSVFPVNFTVLSVGDNCKNRPPKIQRELNITIPICGLYRYKIPSDFASDFEDGNADMLLISLRSNDNTPLPRDSWIQYNQTSREIYAFPPESVARTPQQSGWPYIIIVEDKGGKKTQGVLKVFVEKDIDSYYKLSISFQTINTGLTTSYLDIQISLLSMISQYFGDGSLSRYRVLTFSKTDSNGQNSESFFLQFGNCSVTKQMCTRNETNLTTIYSTMASAANNPSSPFSKYISRQFKITSTRRESSYVIDKPPRVLNGFTVVRVDQCGMFFADVPSATFYDEEQGTSEKLFTRLTFMNGTVPPSNYWMQLIGNKLYIVPYEDVKNGTYNMKLTAKDHCGQSASTTVTTVLSGKNPKNVFRLKLSGVSKTLYPVYNVAGLKNTLKTVFKDPGYRTKVTKYTKNNNKFEMEWINCTVPCDKTSIAKIKSNIFLAKNVVKPLFVTQLEPFFNVTNITEQFSKNCTVPTTMPPVPNRNLSIKVQLCHKLNFSVPVDTFSDPEDGDTRFLSLSLVTESMQMLGATNWVQFDSAKQIFYGYPRIGTNGNFQRSFKYILVARDKEGNSASTPVSVEITGELPRVTYKMSLSGKTRMDRNSPNVAQEISLISKIGRFFNDYSINDIMYSRVGDSIQFAWSFCKMRTDHCDCYKIQETRSKMASFADFQNILSPEFSVANSSDVTEQLQGVCTMTQRPELRFDRNELIVPPGQTFTNVIRNDKFYDVEDGYTRNLTLYTVDDSNVVLDENSWLKIQNYKMCGVLSLSQLEQLGWIKTTTTKEYKVVARDRCGKETRDSFLVRLQSRVPKLGYKITFYLGNSFGKNCTKMRTFVQKISTYLNANQSDIFIYNFTRYNMTNNASVVVWGLRNLTEKNCRNDTVKIVREKFITNEDKVDPKFVGFMRPEYEVIDISDEKSESCANVTVLPPPVLPPFSPFPWWILILLLILALLILLCCLCWICIPRCCPGCCGRFCGCCGKCCQPGGKYASLEEEDGPGGKPDDVEDGKDPIPGTEDDPWDYTADDDLIKSGLDDSDGDGQDNVTGDDGANEDPGGALTPGDTSSVIDDKRDKFSEIDEGIDSTGNDDKFSQHSSVSEDLMNESNADMAETTPMTFGDSPQPSMYPPLYSTVMDERRRSLFGDERDAQDDRRDDTYRDMLSKPLTAPDERIATNTMEKESDEWARSSDTRDDTRTYDSYDSAADSQPLVAPDSYNTTSDRVETDIASRYDQSDDQLFFESADMQESLPSPEMEQGLRLPRPSIDYTNTMPIANTTEYQSSRLDETAEARSSTLDESATAQRYSESFKLPIPSSPDNNNTVIDESVTRNSETRRLSDSYFNQLPIPGQNASDTGPMYNEDRTNYGSEVRRSSQSYTEESSRESFRQSGPMALPSPTQGQPRRGSITRPVEIKIPRSALSALETDAASSSTIDQDAITLIDRYAKRSSITNSSGFDEFLDRRASTSMEDLSQRRRSIGNRSFEDVSVLSGQRATGRRRSDPRIDDYVMASGATRSGRSSMRRSSSQSMLSTDQYSRRPSMEGQYGLRSRSSSPARQGFSTTERRSSRSFVSEEISDNNGRRVSVVESFSASPSGSTNRRRSTSRELMLDTSSDQGPLKMRLDGQDAYRLLKRGSIQLEDGELRSIGGRKLKSSYSDGGFADSGSDMSRMEQSSEGLYQESLNQTLGPTRRVSRAGKRRSKASKAREMNSEAYEYEMGRRGTRQTFINEAYDSDFV